MYKHKIKRSVSKIEAVQAFLNFNVADLERFWQAFTANEHGTFKKYCKMHEFPYSKYFFQLQVLSCMHDIVTSKDELWREDSKQFVAEQCGANVLNIMIDATTSLSSVITDAHRI